MFTFTSGKTMLAMTKQRSCGQCWEGMACGMPTPCPPSYDAYYMGEASLERKYQR